MPKAVSEYAKMENITVVREIQLEILNAYEKDFAKYAPIHQIMNITTVWQQVHRQLAKENKKFIFAAIRKSARGRDYEEAIQWLSDAGLIHKSYWVELPKFPLSAYSDPNTFRLLGAQSTLSPQTIIDGDRLFTEFKGALIENYVAQELIAARQKALYYWASQGTAEVDFLIEKENNIYPVEVKAGINYGEKYNPSKLIRTIAMNMKQNGEIGNYPLYLISQF